MKNPTWRWLVLLLVTAANSKIASPQNAPPTPDRSWPFAAAREIREQAKALRGSRLPFDATKLYSLAELVDFAERNNPETQVVWESAKARAAALRIAQSELYPALAGIAFSQVDRDDLLVDAGFVRQTIATF